MDLAQGLRIFEQAPALAPVVHSCPCQAASENEAALRLQLEAADKTSATYRLILQASGDGICSLDSDGITTFANPAAESMTGWSTGELIGESQHATLQHSYADGSHLPRSACPICLALRDGRIHSSDSEVFWRKDGTCFPVAYTSTPILRDGQPDGAMVIFRDISERKRREAWEQSKNSIFLAITSNVALDATLAMIAEAFVQRFPFSAIAMMTYSANQLRLAAQGRLPASLQQQLASVEAGAGTSDSSFACTRAADLCREVLSTRHPEQPELPPCRELVESAFSTCLALPMLSISGDVLGVVLFFDPEEDAGDIRGMASVNGVCDLFRLAMEHRHLHAELVRESQHDHLTGLPNRLLLEDRLDRAIFYAKRHGEQLAVCCIDLDRFKEINDTMGHAAGDFVLLSVARLLMESLREVDTVARQGGDEFILILPEIRTEAEVDEICQRIMTRLRTPIQMGKQTITVSASIGRCIYPADGHSTSALLKNGDIALYTAKRAGRDRIERFDCTLGEKVQRHIEMQRELRYALERQQFHLVYQPVFRMDSQLAGFEALLRWDHPTFGVVPPGTFIPMAEESGLILSIGEWVLNQACRQAQEWNTASSEPVKIHINVSGVQLNQDNFTGTVASALANSGLTASLLDLEITETCIIADPEAAAMRLRELRQLGIQISIDDFGCGHSSFSYLQQLPVDSIKIDRSFIACLDGTYKKSAILRTIVALAAELGLQTVAEGVETGQQFDELQTTQCGMVQGFLLSKPLSPAAARRLLNRRLLAPLKLSTESCIPPGILSS
jgi:diguanylate cyclase (GGDEF)-like protein/PAS domain S-box-containing protein